MSELRYNDEHLWVRLDDQHMVVVGISQFAQEQLGDIVYVELPDLRREVSAGEEIAIIESVKTTSDIAAPITGEVFEINEALAEGPEIINESPLDDGWLMRIEPADVNEIDALMDEDTYAEFVESEA